MTPEEAFEMVKEGQLKVKEEFYEILKKEFNKEKMVQSWTNEEMPIENWISAIKIGRITGISLHFVRDESGSLKYYVVSDINDITIK